MQISSVSNAFGANSPYPSQDAEPPPTEDAGQNLPTPAEVAQAEVISTPRASLTASATAISSQSIEVSPTRLDTSQLTAAFQSYMNSQGLYGYQSTLGAPLMG
jgi:hypothetical protein